MNQETMKLYKEYGVNPFGGCLPMLVQIPIFFGFYGMLDKAIELGTAPFFGSRIYRNRIRFSTSAASRSIFCRWSWPQLSSGR